jgi:hypothetical protein
MNRVGHPKSFSKKLYYNMIIFESLKINGLVKSPKDPLSLDGRGLG